MRGAGRKRKKDSHYEDRPPSQRSHDDVLNFVYSSIPPEKENLPNVLTKKPCVRPLHCRECDNKFTSPEALERHYENKTNNVGSQVILARNFRKDGSQNISCRTVDCCFSCATLK